MTNPLNTRTMQSVIDTSQPEGQQLRRAQAILDTLSGVGLAQLRVNVRTASLAGKPRFLCPDCGMPLFVAQNPAGTGVPADGRGAHFKHHAIEGAPRCTLRTKRNLREIGAVKFNGLTEGDDHASLKRLLALALSHDPDITDINVERQIRGKDGSWRQPDVSARISGKTAAFDLQLAGAPLATIVDRNAFYAANGYHPYLADRCSRRSSADTAGFPRSASQHGRPHFRARWRGRDGLHQAVQLPAQRTQHQSANRSAPRLSQRLAVRTGG